MVINGRLVAAYLADRYTRLALLLNITPSIVLLTPSKLRFMINQQ